MARFVSVIAMLAFSLTSSGQETATPGLLTGTTLEAGKKVSSPSGEFTLTLQTDGNLVWEKGKQVLWNSGTHGTKDATCCMQADGNLVIYGTRDGKFGHVWASNTAGRSGAFLACQSDGNLVLYSNDVHFWASHSRIREVEGIHPALRELNSMKWTKDLGAFGEKLVKTFHHAEGKEFFNLNDASGHGVDGLVRNRTPQGGFEYRPVEVKTLQEGTDFRLNQTNLGPQLCDRVVEDRLAKAVKTHADPQTRKAAEEALAQFRANPASMRRELHGISISDNRYIIKAVDAAGKVQSELASMRCTNVLEQLAERAKSEDIRSWAKLHRSQFDSVQAARRPSIATATDIAKRLGAEVGVAEKEMAAVLTEASTHVTAPGQSRWIKIGKKTCKFVGKAAGPAGVVVGVSLYASEVAEIEQKVERKELSREEADKEIAKLSGETGVSAGGALVGALAGAAIGSMICPGPGTFVGGIVGAVGGCIGAELAMAGTGLSEKIADFLEPGVDHLRNACDYLESQGKEVMAWMGDKAIRVGASIKRTAIAAKETTVDVADTVGEAVSDVAMWTWRQVKYGWQYVFE